MDLRTKYPKRRAFSLLIWTRRPFEETALDCLQWTREEEAEDEAMNHPSRPRWTDPLTPAREAVILSEWASRRSLAHYSKRHAGKLVDSRDFQRAFEEVTGQDLADMFSKEVYGR